MTNWNDCSAVERTPGRVSGGWVFSGTRIPLFALYENLASSATVADFVEWFPGVEERQARAVLEHEAKTLRTAYGPSVITGNSVTPVPERQARPESPRRSEPVHRP